MNGNANIASWGSFGATLSLAFDFSTGEVGVFQSLSMGIGFPAVASFGVGGGFVFNGGIDDLAGNSLAIDFDGGMVFKAGGGVNITTNNDGGIMVTLSVDGGWGGGLAGMIRIERTVQVASGWGETAAIYSGQLQWFPWERIIEGWKDMIDPFGEKNFSKADNNLSNRLNRKLNRIFDKQASFVLSKLTNTASKKDEKKQEKRRKKLSKKFIKVKGKIESHENKENKVKRKRRIKASF